jgi:hypothetical protein
MEFEMVQDELKKQFKRKGMSDTDATVASMKPKARDGFVDMKRSKEEKKEYGSVSPAREDYPYGLRIDLNDDQMEKLGMELPTVGSTVTLCMKGTVERAELRDTGEGPEASCCIQFKKLKVC